jgi:hypothetical protein
MPSTAATTEIITDPAEIAHTRELLFTEYSQLLGAAPPDAKDFAFLKITPKVISVLNYTKGFGPHAACHALNSSSFLVRSARSTEAVAAQAAF